MTVVDRDGRFNEVEEHVAWTMKFPSGVVASCQMQLRRGMPGYSTSADRRDAAHGPGIQLRGHASRGAHRRGSAHRGIQPVARPGAVSTRDRPPGRVHFPGQAAEIGGEEGLRDMRLMTEIYKSCGRA